MSLDHRVSWQIEWPNFSGNLKLLKGFLGHGTWSTKITIALGTPGWLATLSVGQKSRSGVTSVNVGGLSQLLGG